MSAEDYRAFEQLKIDRLKADIGRGLSDVAAGRRVDGARAFADIRAVLDAIAAAVPKDG